MQEVTALGIFEQQGAIGGNTAGTPIALLCAVLHPYRPALQTIQGSPVRDKCWKAIAFETLETPGQFGQQACQQPVTVQDGIGMLRQCRPILIDAGTGIKEPTRKTISAPIRNRKRRFRSPSFPDANNDSLTAKA